MQRRARIKAVANLSSIRRGTNKSSADNQPESEENLKKDEKQQNKDIDETSTDREEPAAKEVPRAEPQNEAIPDVQVNNDDVNKKNVSLEKLNEEPKEVSEKCPSKTNDVVNNAREEESHVEQEKSKAPEDSNTARAENANPVKTVAAKFRKPKITPRLSIQRAVTKEKVQENEEKEKKNEKDDAIAVVENPIAPPAPSPVVSEKAPESPISLFSPPRTPRAETPREILDSPVISHNVHPTSQSPFHIHPRIRTESLCSIKSTTVANLQPRKKVRTEDQKILDNKRESRERLSNKTIEKSQLRMFDMIYYNPTSNPMKPRAPPPKEKPQKKIDLTAELPPQPSQSSSAAPVPQLKFNANGEMVLDEESLVVENEEQKKNRILLANTNVVYHDELSGTYGYYKRQQRTKEWPQEETIKFYRCLNTVGTDFSLMLNLFPNRSRRDLKLKFKKEEKTNPHLVNKALLNHNTFDIEELQREFDEEDEIRRKEKESRSEVKELVKRKILKKQEAKAKDKAKIEKILSDGDLVLNTVNESKDVKENLEKSQGSSSTKGTKRAPKRKAKPLIKPEPHMEFKKIVLNSQYNSSISVNELKSSTSSFVVPKDPPAIKSSIVVREMSACVVRNETSLLTALESTTNSTVEPQLSTTKSENTEEGALVDSKDSLLSKTGKFISDLITDSYPDSQESDYQLSEDDSLMNNIKKEEPVPRAAIQEISQPTEPNQFENDVNVDIVLSSDSLNNLAKLQDSETNQQPCFTQEESYTVTEVLTEQAIDSPIIRIEPSLTDPPQEVPDTSVDDEAFLNSLDLERLVIVVKQVDGKDLYDIHETDADTQLLSEKPLNLPRHIVDLIVSVMTQDD